MKYIIFEVPCGSDLVRRVPVIFSEDHGHSSMASSVTQQAGMWESVTVSAGFFDLHSHTCHGGSLTLKLGSRVGDYAIILYPQAHKIGAPTNPSPM